MHRKAAFKNEIIGSGRLEPIGPDDVTAWVKGTVLIDSIDKQWEGMRLRRYRFDGQDVIIPPLRDAVIVAYKQGITPASRRVARDWKNEILAPGDVAMLTDSQSCQWRWTESIQVTHLYLAPDSLAKVAADVFERDVAAIELHDTLRVEDPLLPAIVAELERELLLPRVGERLYIDSLRIQASIQLLRHYANITFRAIATSGTFSPAQKRRIEEYVRHTLDEPITLKDLAGELQIGVFQFCRKFRNTFGSPPHAWLLLQRVAMAKMQIERGSAPLKSIAADAGFTDQSHMTRVFQRVMGVTPGEYRAATGAGLARRI